LADQLKTKRKVDKLFELGLSYTQIGNKLGMNRTTVRRWLMKVEKVQPRPPRSERYAKVIELSELGRSYTQISTEVEMHPATVKKWLISAGRAQAKPKTSQRYAHISIAKVTELHDLGRNNRQIGSELGMTPSTVGNWLRKAGKATRKAVTAEELKECILDLAWEARCGIRNRVVCRECGKFKPSINDPKSNHLLEEHHMTAEEYARKYPCARLMSFDIAASHLRFFYHSSSRPTKTADELMTEFAAKHLTPVERQEYLKDLKFEEHHGIKNFAACRLCGFKCKFRLSDHLLSRHSISPAAYRVRFPKSPLLPLSKEESERDRSRKKGRALREELAALRSARPDDWDDVPIEWRIVGGELLSRKEYMSNEELAERLDGSRILRCPYATNWKTALTRPSRAANFISEVRAWVNRPGRSLRKKKPSITFSAIS
jgi:DNA-directed RNA polymerase specialized sigma24 family protein